MDLPFFKRGMELLASQLNRLSDNVRSSTITSVIGGRFSRTPGGTTLIIDAGTQTSSGDAGTCYYSATDVSPAPNNLKIEVARQLLPVQAGEEGNPYRYPYGMNAQDPFIMDINSLYDVWVGLYLKLEFNEDGIFRQYPKAATFRLSDRPLVSGDQNQFILCASITISRDEDNKKYISNIDSLCPLIAGTPLTKCHFGIEDAGLEYPDPNTAMVEVRVGTLNGTLPTGMVPSRQGVKYLLDIPDGDWHSIYLVVALDEDGNISTEENAVTFGVYDVYKKSTDSIAYILAGEISTSYDEYGMRYISAVRSYCVPQFWNTRGGTSGCLFGISDASYQNESQQLIMQIQVAFGIVQWMSESRIPDGMSFGGPPYYLPIEETCYVYLVALFDPTSLKLNDAPTALTFTTSPDLISNTANTQYVLVGTVLVETNPETQVKSISTTHSVCSVTLNPCMLEWTAPII
jgi:hypothetical protein